MLLPVPHYKVIIEYCWHVLTKNRILKHFGPPLSHKGFPDPVRKEIVYHSWATWSRWHELQLSPSLLKHLHSAQRGARKQKSPALGGDRVSDNSGCHEYAADLLEQTSSLSHPHKTKHANPLPVPSAADQETLLCHQPQPGCQGTPSEQLAQKRGLTKRVLQENTSWGPTAKHPDIWKFLEVLKEGGKFEQKSTAVKTKTLLGCDSHTFKKLLNQKFLKDKVRLKCHLLNANKTSIPYDIYHKRRLKMMLFFKS